MVASKQGRIDSLKSIPLRLIPDDYYGKTLGFFCKKELQLEKVVKIPFRFRLGSVDYVDRLEGKHSPIIPPGKQGPVH